MLYREAGQFKTTYAADQQIFPIRQDRIGVMLILAFAFVVVPLIANQYWFSAAANSKAKKIAVELYDETGRPLTTDSYNDGERASAGFSPSSSGQYFVSVGLLEGEPTTFCLVYSYK